MNNLVYVVLTMFKISLSERAQMGRSTCARRGFPISALVGKRE